MIRTYKSAGFGRLRYSDIPETAICHIKACWSVLVGGRIPCKKGPVSSATLEAPRSPKPENPVL